MLFSLQQDLMIKTLKNPERPSSRMVVKSFTWKGTPTAPFAPTLTTSRTPESSLRWWWKSSHEFWVYPSFGCLGALLEKFIWSKRSNFIRTSTKSKNFIRTVKWTLRPEAWGLRAHFSPKIWLWLPVMHALTIFYPDTAHFHVKVIHQRAIFALNQNASN